MNDVLVRLLKEGDFDSIVKIDTQITGEDNSDYYKQKLSGLTSKMGTSLVAEVDNKVVGFLLADLFYGEYGIPSANAFVDTIGVDPAMEGGGIGYALIDQLKMNLKAANAEKIYTLVNWNDQSLIKFFQRSGFIPSERVSLEFRI